MPPSEDKHSKTEKPTAKRKKEARDDGRIPKSPDVAASAALLGASFVIPGIYGRGEKLVFATFANSLNVVAHPTTAAALTEASTALKSAFVMIIVIGAMFAGLGTVSNLAQTGPVLSSKALKPKWDHLSPKAGIKRLASPQTLFALGRQSVKLALIGGVGMTTIKGLMHAVPATVPLGLSTSIGIGSSTLLSFVRVSGALGLGVGLADFVYSRHKIGKMLKMTKQEVKEEAKSAEGDPTMKGELRKRGYQIARSKSIAAVRTADLVVANPTHFCVAIQYQPASKAAPRVVAKGRDSLALRMRDEATTFDVPIVEDPPLARYLYASCDVGSAIPAEIYYAVAKLLAFIYSLPLRRRSGTHHRAASVVPYDPGPDLLPRPKPKIVELTGSLL